MTLIITVMSAIILIFGIIIGTQNGNTFVNFYLLKWEFENISLTLLVIQSIIIGIIITIILSGVNTIKLKLQVRDILKENKNLQREIKALKNLPFEEGEGEPIEDFAKIEEENDENEDEDENEEELDFAEEKEEEST